MRSHESNLSDGRRRLERKLLEKLKAAEQDYRNAVSEFRSLADQSSKDSGSQQALRNAIAVERTALEKYQAALRVFTDFVVRDIPPPPFDD
jgi:hypothetical protein